MSVHIKDGRTISNIVKVAVAKVGVEIIVVMIGRIILVATFHKKEHCGNVVVSSASILQHGEH